jgi:NitT/TauT family transport system permease protein
VQGSAYGLSGYGDDVPGQGAESGPSPDVLPAGRRRRSSALRRAAGYAWAVIFIVAAWQALSVALGHLVLPRPWSVFQNFAGQLGNPAFQGHALASVKRLALGLAAGFAIAFPLGVAMGRSSRLDAVMAPVMFLTYPVPKVLFLPALLVVFGLGEAPKTVLVALVTGYQILVVTRDAVRGMDPRWEASFATFWPAGKAAQRARREIALWRHVTVPCALPAAMTALRLAAGTAVSVLFIAESFATDRGLGLMIVDAWGAMDLPRMWSGILAMGLLGAAFFEAAYVLERLLCPASARKGA